mgnify:CR=1 FL=1
MKIVIIEDEIPAARRLEKMVKELDTNIEILAKLDSIETAVAWFGLHGHPDVAFMDIELADGQSFEIFKQVEIKCPVIFTTAYDEYALKAFKVNSIDYLLKPIEAEALKQSFEKWKSLQNVHSSYDIQSLVDSITGKKDYKKRFLVRLGDRLISVENEHIAYFLTEDKYSFLVTTDNKKYILDQPLDEIERQLNPLEFFRLNRQFIAPHKSISGIHSHLNGKLKVSLLPAQKDEIFVSREKAAEFKSWLDS